VGINWLLLGLGIGIVIIALALAFRSWITGNVEKQPPSNPPFGICPKHNVDFEIDRSGRRVCMFCEDEERMFKGEFSDRHL